MTRLTLLIATCALISVANAQCPSIRTRYECREMTEASRNTLFNAFKKLMTGGGYTKYVDMHIAVTSTAHGTPEFLPWHRHYLHALEKELDAPLCYWDWATDAQAPEVSIINGPGWCGSDGGGNCVKDSFYGGYTYQNECVSTQWDGGAGKIGSFYSIDYIAKLISESDSYDGFRVPYEGTAHARVHNGLGGMFSKMMSPANPAFFFHHANVDRHYAIWQWAHPTKAKDFPKPLTTELPEYKGVQVGSTMDTRANPYCYTYSNIDIISTGRSTSGLNRRALKLSTPVKFNRRGGDCASKCGGVNEATGLPNPPCDDDRTNVIDLRAVKPTPDSWCKMNNVNCTEIRKHEEKHRGFINDLNDLPGYVSPSALYNRPLLLGELVKRGGTNFYLYNEKHEKVSLPCPQQYKDAPEKAIEVLRESVKKSYSVKEYKDLGDSLRKVVGKLADTLMKIGDKSAMKPYVEIKDAEVDKKKDADKKEDKYEEIDTCEEEVVEEEVVEEENGCDCSDGQDKDCGDCGDGHADDCGDDCDDGYGDNAVGAKGVRKY